MGTWVQVPAALLPPNLTRTARASSSSGKLGRCWQRTASPAIAPGRKIRRPTSGLIVVTVCFEEAPGARPSFPGSRARDSCSRQCAGSRSRCLQVASCHREPAQESRPRPGPQGPFLPPGLPPEPGPESAAARIQRHRRGNQRQRRPPHRAASGAPSWGHPGGTMHHSLN